MKRFLFLCLGVAFLSLAGRAMGDSVTFKYNIYLQNNTAPSLAFGRVTGALDSFDKEDAPFPPNLPEVAGINEKINYPHFVGTDSKDASYTVTDADSLQILAFDMRNPDTTSSTWRLVISTIAADSLTARWSAEIGPELSNGTLQLLDADYNVLVDNMLTTDTYEFTKTGNYYIRFIADNVVAEDVAPATPDPIEADLVVYPGKVFIVILLDEAALTKFEVILNSLQAVYFKGGEIVNKPLEGTRGDPLSYDSTTGILTYTVPSELFDFDTVKIFYDIKSIGASDDAGTAQGVVRAVVSNVPAVTLSSVTVNGTAVKDNSKAKVNFTDDNKTAYQDVVITYTVERPQNLEKSSLPTTFTFPTVKDYDPAATFPWTYSVTLDDVSLTEGTDFTFNSDATATINYSVTFDSDDVYSHTIAFTLTPATTANGGDALFTAIYNDGQNDEQIPTDSSDTTVDITLVGDGNLDVFQDDKVNRLDAQTIYRYIQEDSMSKKDEDYPCYLTRGTSKKNDSEEAQKILEIILALDDRLDVFPDDKVNRLDAQSIYRYIQEDSMSQDDEDYPCYLTRGTSLKNNKEKANEILENIKALLP